MVISGGTPRWPNPMPLPPMPIDQSNGGNGPSHPEYEQELAMINEYFLPSWVIPLQLDAGGVLTLRGDNPQLANLLSHHYADKLFAGGDETVQRTLFLFYGPPPFDYARLNTSADANNDTAYDTVAGVRVSLNKDTGVVSYAAAPDLYIVGDLLKHSDYAISLIDAALTTPQS